MRVCHIVESLDKGAVEAWLSRTILHSATEFPDFHWTIYCTLTNVGRNVDALREAGVTVVASPVPFGQTLAFLAAMRSYLRARHFDVVHCHHDFQSGFYLWAAAGLAIKQRWVHVHNTDEALPTPSRWKHRLLLGPLRKSCLRMADGVIGISNHVLDQFLRFRPRRPERDFVRYYGLDVNPIRTAQRDPQKFRSELELPPDARLLLFVGRMSPLKNPVFVVDVLAATLKQVPNAYAVFVGEGDLTEQVERRSHELGVSQRIRMLGWRDDIASIMKNSDVFVFPRPETPLEGLGLVVVESQACGLPMLTTKGIAEDAIVDPGMVKRIPLWSPADEWARHVVELLNSQPTCDCDTIAASRFGMDTTTQQLLALYDRAR